MEPSNHFMKTQVYERRIAEARVDRARVKTMNIVFFAHPDFMAHVSLTRFTKMLVVGMKERGHSVDVWQPQPKYHDLPLKKMKKWLGYLDNYYEFPKQVRERLKNYPKNTLFVFTDNALGPWVPLVSELPHVIHCHDFMAQQSALGLIPDITTRWSGKQYQKLIRNGYRKGKNFISGSENTRKALRELLETNPTRSELVYNGLHQSFNTFDPYVSRIAVGKALGLSLEAGYILHVGGNQWYKNRVGVIEMYAAWRASTELKLPLLLIGLSPSEEVLEAANSSNYKNDIHFITNAHDGIVNYAYSGATVFLFPSKAEGFGWPVAEAMASGCPVITTNEAPMTEVAGSAGFFVPRRPVDSIKARNWAIEAGKVIGQVVSLSEYERRSVINAGLENAKRFDTHIALDRIENIYHDILNS